MRVYNKDVPRHLLHLSRRNFHAYTALRHAGIVRRNSAYSLVLLGDGRRLAMRDHGLPTQVSPPRKLCPGVVPTPRTFSPYGARFNQLPPESLTSLPLAHA